MPTTIVDCDPGLDDAVALLVVASGHVDRVVHVDSVFAVGGNASAERTARNAAQILEAAGLGCIPVFRGASVPTRAGGPPVDAASIHGVDGLGGLADPSVRAPGPSRDPGAVLADRIVAAARPVELLCTGPLTDVAAALRSDRSVTGRIGRLVVMGGALGSPPGNVTPWAEFNFFADPGAAAAVCSSGLPVELVPLDVTHAVTFGAQDAEGLAPLAAGLITRSVALHRQALGLPFAYLHDAVAAAVLLRPDLCERRRRDLHVTASGPRSGHVRAGTPSTRTRSTVVTGIDAGAAKEWILRSLVGPCQTDRTSAR